ncbi:glycosyl hydrolase family 26 [Vibrio cholerae]|nr:glycosyl hydrolase family 26 [Vibrio cholerae]
MPIREQVSTVDVKIENEGQKPEVIYTVNTRSQTIYCFGLVNDMQMLDNLKTHSGTFSSGFNPTAYLQPGENTLEKWPPIFGHDFKWSICFDSTQQYRDRL